MSDSKNLSANESTSEAVTNNVRVEVESQYAPEHSQPFQSHWFFYYTIRITNEGEETVQLLSRHWIATDGMGKTEEVRGSGVVGEQPVLGTGILRGTYQMVTEGGTHFDVEIAPFALREPYTVH
jgi:ApaG protein